MEWTFWSSVLTTRVRFSFLVETRPIIRRWHVDTPSLAFSHLWVRDVTRSCLVAVTWGDSGHVKQAHITELSLSKILLAYLTICDSWLSILISSFTALRWSFLVYKTIIFFAITSKICLFLFDFPFTCNFFWKYFSMEITDHLNWHNVKHKLER